MLTWDVIVLNGYLVLNLAIPFYILYSHFRGREPNEALVRARGCSSRSCGR